MSSATLVGWDSSPVLGGLGKPSCDKASWHFWLAASLLGFLFFMTNHDIYVSLLPDYAHYDDSVISVAIGTNFVRRITFFLLAGLGLWFASISLQSPWKFNPWIVLPMFGYIACCCTSVLWSAEPAMGLKRVITLLCYYLCAFGLGRRFSMRELAWMMFLIIAAYFAIGLALELALGTFRPWQSGHRFAGSLHPNSQAAHLTMMCLAAFALAPGDKGSGVFGVNSLTNREIIDAKDSRPPWFQRNWLYVMVAIGLVFIALARSRTNLAGAFIALAAIAALRSSLKVKLGAVYLGLLAACAGLLVLMLAGKDPLTQLFEAAMLGREDDVASLSGRGFIWPVCWEHIAQRPWLGYGYGAFWTPTRIEFFLEEIQFSIFEAHNGYLELMLGTGIVGCVLYVAFMLTSLFTSATAALKTNQGSYALLFGVMVFAFIYSNSESGFMEINLVALLMTSQMLNLALCPAAAGSAADDEVKESHVQLA